MRNVYDFDKTIYQGDSTVDFYLFCLRKKPKILKHLLQQCVAMILYKMGRISKTKMKEKFYVFLQDITIVDVYVDEFWQKNSNKFAQWYLQQQQEDDLIISASPEFLLKPICEQIGIQHLIASKVNKEDGTYIGLNCYGTEKVIRFQQEYPNEKIYAFYSDSYSDKPLVGLAESAYLVKGNIVSKWER